MGRLYPSEKVYNGDIPAADGRDHVEAAKKFLDEMRKMDDPDSPLSGMTFGSVITGNANRRSDVDFLVVYYSLQQLEDLGEVIAEIDRRHNVMIEAQTFQLGAFNSPATHDVSPLFGAHLLDVQDNHPGWTIGSAIEPLRDFVAGPDSNGEAGFFMSREEYDQKVLRDVMSYAHYKLRLFASSSLMAKVKGSKDLYVMQRALELPKGLGRKAGAIVSTLGGVEVDLDVTDREAMKESFAQLIELTGDEEMVSLYDELIKLDAEYDQLLEEAILTGEIADYDEWINMNSNRARKDAHNLADAFARAVDRLAEERGIGLDEAPLQAMR